MNPSFVHGANDVPLKYATLGCAFDEAASRWKDRDALIVPQQRIRWTYGQLKARVDRLAAGLLALGLVPGDRVGIWAPNCAQWTVAQFATAKAGLILVNINPAYRLPELEFSLNKVGCRALLTADRFKSSDYLGMLRTLSLPHLSWLIRFGTDSIPGFLNVDALMSSADERGFERLRTLETQLQPDDAINIQFTSGTTGLPKGATLSHFNILNNGYFVGRALHLSELDRVCIPVPLYHCFGMVLGNLAALTHGAAMLYPAESFDPKATLEAVARERATVLYGVPTMFIAELEHPEFGSYDVSSLRTGIMAGAPCPVEIMKRVIRELHIGEITIAYGMTETSPVSFQSATDDSIERRVSTVGRVHPHIQVKVVDSDGHCVPRGTRGELCTRGYSVMKGYWDDAEKTREAIDTEGWMHTGDLGVIDADGYCNITGRVKDMLIRGGENIFPREIEEFLHSHAKVQAVQVCGVPDSRYGEEVCAWIQLKPGCSAGEEEIREFCRGRIAHFKIPRYVRFVAAFPMTVTGKVQKYAMREQMKIELGLTEARTA
ncbi:MAG TPA: AMP-binding protein [Steroidobacteraceae bacterium]|nr:AMP-binding protein [Steroidobacteraceae bacterium]